MTVEPQVPASKGVAGLDSVAGPETEVEVKKPLQWGSYSGETTAAPRLAERLRVHPWA